MGHRPRLAAPRDEEGSTQVTSERRQEIRKVLAGALERTPQERSAYLDQVCAEGDYPRARSLYAEYVGN